MLMTACYKTRDIGYEPQKDTKVETKYYELGIFAEITEERIYRRMVQSGELNGAEAWEIRSRNPSESLTTEMTKLVKLGQIKPDL